MMLTDNQKFSVAFFVIFLVSSALALFFIATSSDASNLYGNHFMLGFSLCGALFSILLFFSSGKVMVPQKGFVKPDLHRLVFSGKYSIPIRDIDEICNKITSNLNPINRINFFCTKLPKGMRVRRYVRSFAEKQSIHDAQSYEEGIKKLRKGAPVSLTFSIIGEDENNYTVQTDCYPVMYNLIAQDFEWQFLEHHIEDAEVQCINFTREIFIGILGGTEIEKPAPSPKITKSETKSRLSFMGLQDISSRLDYAERDLDEGRYNDAVGNMRTALGNILEFYMKAKSLEKTRQVKGNIERLGKHGFLTQNDKELIYKQIYSPMSEIVKGRKNATKAEAKMFLNLLITIIEYILDRA
jgi:predicted DNA-binding protein with PD1-like motif